MGGAFSNPPQSLDEILNVTTEQAWEAIRQLPELRPFVFNNDEGTRISLSANKEDLARFKKHAVVQFRRPIEEVVQEMRDIFSFIVRPNHPRFMSAIPSPSSPISWLGEVLTSAFNSWPAAWSRMPASTGGTFVSGGSMANLSALAIARDQKLAENTRSLGVVYFSDQTHFSVPKVLRLLGFSNNQMRQLPADSNFRLDMVQLEKTIAVDKSKGFIPFLIVANAGSTNTGSIDPLNEIADLAKKYNMWMHVDGAYGASVALSKSHKSLLAGIERCDSLAWDAHKWLFQTFGCGIVLVHDKSYLAQSFTSTGDYFRDIPSDDAEPNLFNYGIELTRPARHMKLWFTLRVLGLETLECMIDQGLAVARFAEAELRKLSNWEITSPAILGVVTFKYCPDGLEEKMNDAINDAISAEIIKSNVAYIQTTRIRGRVSLRICVIHPEITNNDMQNIITTLNNLALNIVEKYK
ncbi:pyridoxal phosphate-dependent transferase [Trichoderma evansii]